MIEDEEFFAWLDGELQGEAAARIAAQVAASPELSARADKHRKLAVGLRAAFDPVMAEALAPPRLDAGQVIDFGVRAAVRDRSRRWPGVPQWAAMAATLALGLVVGNMIGDRSTPVQNRGGTLVATAALDRALDKQLASAGAHDGVRVGLTFRDRQGSICRSFSDGGASGLACHADGDWQIRGLFQGADGGQASEYRMAAGEDPRLAALIDETIAGEPFDAAAERAALEKDWR